MPGEAGVEHDFQQRLLTRINMMVLYKEFRVMVLEYLSGLLVDEAGEVLRIAGAKLRLLLSEG